VVRILKKISVFDADACILMGKPTNTGYSLLSELVLYFDESYIHKFVLDEVKSNTPARSHLESLENQKLIEAIDDDTLLDMLYSGMHDNETAACSYYHSLLIQHINALKPAENAKLTAVYSPVINKAYTLRVDLITDLRAVETGIPDRTSAGELKTSILVDILHFLNVAEINFFVSNDRRARALLVTTTDGRVKTSSPIGTFIIFRDTGWTRAESEPYLRKLGSGRSIQVKDINGKWATLTYQQIFDDIFAANSGLYLTADGFIHYS
jgi:hypothetical protein